MPDTLPNVKLPKGGTWIDIYDALGIAVGTPLVIQSLSTASVQFTVKATEPLSTDGHKLLAKGEQFVVPEDSSGVWISSLSGGAVNVDVSASPVPISLYDGFGNPIDSLSNALDVHIADVHNIPVNDFFHRHTATQTTLNTATVSGDIQLDVDDTSGFSVGDLVHLGAANEYVEPRHPIVTGIPNATTLVLDGPVHNVFPVDAAVTQAVANMASLDGTLQAPISYRYFTGVNRVEHITRILISMTHTGAGADDLFGGIAALLNGIHFRARINNQFGTFTNWKTNGELKLDMYDIDYSVKSGPGDFGTNGRGSFSRIGVVVRLDSSLSDFLEILVQDTVVGLGLTDLRIKVQGHVEGQ